MGLFSREKKFIKIESKGVIETQAFSLLGASSKRGDNSKIGFFGSGLKYSIAYLMRNKINFKVFAEYKEVRFTTTQAEFRNQGFEIICVDGKETSMTTEMGIDWQAWFILREIYCNAIDEGDSAISVVEKSECVPVEDKTVFYIEATDEFDEVIKNWHLYFSESRKDLVYHDKDMNQLYAGSKDLIVYRKGIRCSFEKDQASVFHYDMQWIDINESREIKSSWDFKWKLRGALQKCTDADVIKQLLTGIIDKFEAGLDWKYETNLFSEKWCEIIGSLILIPHENCGFWSDDYEANPRAFLILPNNLIEALKSRFPDIRVIGCMDGSTNVNRFRIIETLSKRQTFLLDEAKKFLTAAGYTVEYPINVVRFIDDGVLGQAKDNNIYVSEKLFDRGRKELVRCIIEEQEHLVTGYNDETRQFQNHFIGKYVSELENKANIFL